MTLFLLLGCRRGGQPTPTPVPAIPTEAAAAPASPTPAGVAATPVAPAPAEATAPSLPAPAPPAAGDLTLGLHIGLDAMAEYNFATNTWDEEVWPQNMAANLDWMIGLGYRTLLLDAIATEGYFFESDLLAEQGYVAFPDVLRPFMEAAHARGVTVFADVTVLAWRLNPYTQATYNIQGNPLSVAQVQEVVATLLDDYGVDGIVEETYAPDYIAGIYEVCRARGRPYIHKFDDAAGNADILMSEDYVGYLDSPQRAKQLNRIGAAANNLGLFNLLFAHARAIGKPAAVKVYGGWDLSPGASRNVFLLRAVQFQPDGYFWMVFGDDQNVPWLKTMDTGDLAQWLDYLRTPPEPKPIANVVVGVATGDYHTTDPAVELMDLATIHTFGALSNGLMLAGYDVRASYGAPLPGAAAYVLMLPGGWWDGQADLPGDVLALLDGPVPVIVAVAGALPDSGNWATALPKLGIAPGWEADVAETMPETVEFEGQRVRWRGLPIWGYEPTTSLIRPDEVSGEVLASGRVEGETVALVIRRGNVVFLNGNVLNLDATFVVNRLLSDVLQTPCYCYGTVGQRSAFMAMGDTSVVARLPFEEGAPLRVIRFGEDGHLAADENIAYRAPFRADLARHELLIVERV